MPLNPVPLNQNVALPKPDIGSGLDSLMQQFKEARLQSARKDAMQGLMSGDPKTAQSAIMKLMAVDPDSGYKAAQAYKSLHPDLDPYKALSAQIQLLGAHTAERNADIADRREKAYEQDLTDPRRRMSEKRRTFCAQYPQLCPELNQAPTGGGAGAAASTPDNTLPPVNVAPVADSVSYTDVPANTPPTTDPRGAYIPAQAPSALPPQPSPQPAPTANPSVPKSYEQYQVWQKAPVEQAEGHYNQVVDVLDRAQQQAQVIFDDPELYKVVGFWGMGGQGPVIPGSHAADILAAIDTLTNQIGLAQMQDIRDQTKSGASPFQRTTNFEFGALMHSIASLKTTQSVPQFKKHLQYILTALDHAKTRAGVSFQNTYNRAPNLIEYDKTEVPKGGATGGGGTTSVGGLKWSVSP